jgi:putative hydrolase of the HAD superfamily
MNLKYILFDLDGLIRHFPASRQRAIEERYQLPPGSILREAFDASRLSRAITGRIADEVWRMEIMQALRVSHSREQAEAAARDRSSFPGEVDWELLQLIEDNFPGVPLAILTNATTRRMKAG